MGIVTGNDTASVPKIVSLQETCRLLRIDENAIHRYIFMGRLRPYRNRRGKLTFSRENVLRAKEASEFAVRRPEPSRNDPSMG